ncbi:2OG-Fe(II) oxygenase family protein [Egbenema bharatensis]|uniref:2OG-Fe(II) oxygenase family protein n=1 Tax=Egbenema bharatensis TaxID=3463334 RepID=UPI003A883B87
MKTPTYIPELPDPTLHQTEFALQLHKALTTVGAAYIPTVSVLEEQRLLDCLKAFFALNELQKRALAHQLPSPWQGVFLPLGEEQLANGQDDYKEAFDLNSVQGVYARWATRRKARQCNQSAEANKTDQAALLQVVQPLFQVFDLFQGQANHVLAAIERAYQQPSNSLIAKHGKNSTLRLLHYPPAPHLAPGSIRLGTHQDYSGITLLWHDTTGGLEILTPDQEWVAVDIPPGHIGVIVSEVMQLWSGDTLYGAPHRVRITHVQQLQKARYAIAFFCETNADCIIYPGSLLHKSAMHPPNGSVEPISIEQFLTQKYDQIMERVRF